MVRRAAAVVLALTLNPALVRAQDTVLTISVPSADVHKGPSVATPVIGHIPRGVVLPIARNLGSWVKITWREAPDGFGYVHVSTGRIGAPPITSAAASPSPRPAAPASPTATIPPTPRLMGGEQVVPSSHRITTPASHLFGIGGLIGTPSAIGATARAWRDDNRLGIQFAFTRDVMTSATAEGRVRSMLVEPGVVYGLADRVGDYVWVRPYVGSVVSFRQQTLRLPSPIELEPASDRSVGFRVFGGTELMFSSAPRFGLSIDAGWRHASTPFAGFEVKPFNVAIAGHWYVR